MAAEQSASVSVQWQTDDAQRFGTIYLTVSGAVELDAALDALLAGFDASEYLVTRALKTVTSEEDYRPRPSLAERTPEPRVQVVDSGEESRPAPAAEESPVVRVVKQPLRVRGAR